MACHCFVKRLRRAERAPLPYRSLYLDLVHACPAD
jgi:hypothetical protein